MVMVSLKDRDGIRVRQFFTSVPEARAFAAVQSDCGARNVRIAVR